MSEMAVGVEATASPAAMCSSPRGVQEQACAEPADRVAPPGGAWSVLRSLLGGGWGRVGSKPLPWTGSRTTGAISESGPPDKEMLSSGCSSGSRGGSRDGSGARSQETGTGRPQVMGEERAVAPHHSARPLCEILHEIELSGIVPPGPRLS